MPLLHPDRLFPSDTATRDLARRLFGAVEHLPIISPHGHTDPKWWGQNPAFSDAAELFVIPDHYVTRLLVSQGVHSEALGYGEGAEPDRRTVWRTFAEHYHLFRGTPTRLWLDHAFLEVFDIQERLSPATADDSFDAINEKLGQADYHPRALYDRFGIEAIATTDSAIDDLADHRAVANSSWQGRVLPTYRPDSVSNPEDPAFLSQLDQLAERTGISTDTWDGYLDAHRERRTFFKLHGATATDHGFPTPQTADLSLSEAKSLFARVRSGNAQGDDHVLFRAQMLTEFARMSCEDGLVMQLHCGSTRDHSPHVFERDGQNRGFDIPSRTGFVAELKPLLDAVGFQPDLQIILFTLDESTYSRELAPLAGAYPCLKLGPPWWFHDSFEGMLRFRRMATETAGFYNTVGFNDDTRALCSIPARHDVARRVDCAFLAELVSSHRLDETEAFELAPLLSNGLAREGYRLS